MSEEGKTIIEIANLRIKTLEQRLKIAVEFIEDLAFGGFNITGCLCKHEAKKVLEKIKELENES